MRQWWIRALAIASVMVVCASATPAFAQGNRGRLIVTVTDMTGAVLPNATVVVAGLEQVTRAAVVAPVQADTNGIATLANLAPGRYSLEASFPSFDKALIKEVRVRAGDNRQTLVLKLSGFSDSVSVGRDRQESASDRSQTFGTALTREQIEALPDDETEMANQLRALGGPDAIIKVDSFEGAQLPPKSQIKSIRITRDQFAAENHYAGGISIDIVTQPGIGPLRTNIRSSFYDSALDGRNDLISQRTPTKNRNYGGGITGTLIPNKSSFSLNLNGQNQFQIPVAYGYRPEDGTPVTGNMGLRQPTNSWGYSGSLDYALTKDQTLRAGFSRNTSRRDNLGLGGINYDLQSAYQQKNANTSFRIQESGPLGRRFFTSTRFSIGVSRSESFSAVELPTINVLSLSSIGGAQQAGGSRNQSILLAQDLDYIRGRHSVRMGLQVEGQGYRTDQRSNYLGTYTFVGLDEYKAGAPRSYTKRIGDPTISYWNVQTGLYLQDDIKLRKNLTMTPGIRYELQTHVGDKSNVGPRFGLTWAPFKNGQTTLRGSAGVFYDWLGTGTYEQTLRLDGFHQQEINIINPSYPDPGADVSSGVVATNRYLLGGNVRMARTTRYSAGINQTLWKKLSLGLTYSDSRGTGLLVGQNLNAPLDGARPDPQFANIIATVSDGRSRQKTASFNSSLNLSRTASGPPSGPGRLFDWRRGLYVSAYHSYNRAENDTDGAFAPPASGDLALEWGPGPFDVRNRTQVYISTSALRNLNGQFGISMSSAPALNVQSGTDTNGDLIFNDRPAGFGRNSARTTGQWSADGYISYSFGLGRQRMVQSQGVMITQVNGVLSASAAAAQNAPRYRINISCDIRNLTNHANLTGYVGLINSPLYLHPTSVQGVRRITFNMG
ncbi:MAG: TonB-dependent receptor, partial [Acidobacteriota bacterium]